MRKRAVSPTHPHLAERKVQRANLDLLARLGYQVAHVPNGVPLGGDKLARAKQMARLKADGLRPGFPDLVVFDKPRFGIDMMPRVGVIECKEEGEDKLDPDQEWWRDELQRCGHYWALVNTPEGSLAALREWGWRP